MSEAVIFSDPRIIKGLSGIPEGLTGLFVSEGGQTYFIPDLPGYENLQFELLGYLQEEVWGGRSLELSNK